MKFTISMLLFLLVSVSVFAEPIFPLNSLRRQLDGTCWAYGASHMMEARLERREDISAVIDIEKSYLYWQIYDRLLNSFARKKASDGLTDVGGFAGNLWYIMATHGLEINKSLSQPTHPNFEYPTRSSFLISTPSSYNGLRDSNSVRTLEQELITTSMSQKDAEEKIVATLNKAFSLDDQFSEETNWLSEKVPTKNVFSKMMGADLPNGAEYSPRDFVLVTSYFVKDHPELNGQWLKYDDDRLWGIGMNDTQKQLEIARVSMDRGWPTTVETDDHVMTLLGYKVINGTNYYAVSDSSGAYFGGGLSWRSESEVREVMVDVTVYYPIVKDLLPAIPQKTFQNILTATGYPAVQIPKKY